jgi:hypothetical protein
VTPEQLAEIAESAQYLIDHWTEPAFARSWQHDSAIARSKDVLALLAEVERLREERDQAREALRLTREALLRNRAHVAGANTRDIEALRLTREALGLVDDGDD